jgi:hypothetical protein
VKYNKSDTALSFPMKKEGVGEEQEKKKRYSTIISRKKH